MSKDLWRFVFNCIIILSDFIFFFLLFFYIKVFYNGHWQINGLQGKEGTTLISLYPFHLLTNIQIFICNFTFWMTTS